jgi:hypothetical protein
VVVVVVQRGLPPTQTQMADRVAAVVEAEGRTLQFQAVALRHQAVKAMQAAQVEAGGPLAAAAAAEQVVLAAIGRP